MKTIRMPRPTARRVAAVAALVGIAGGGSYAVASVGAPPSRIKVPAQEVHQASGVDRVPALPLVAGLPDVYSASDGPVQTDGVASPWMTAGTGTGANGIPRAALAAYTQASRLLAQADGACGLDWALLAGIGKVESDHGRWGGNALDATGRTRPGIYGLPLDGAPGIALIHDTDGGSLDRDPVFDRAVGPMQFIPGTWRVVGADGDGDGTADPQNMTDAATAAGIYLCSGHSDLRTSEGATRAILRYNNSADYVREVLSYANAYRGGYTVLPDGQVDTGLTAWLPPGLQPATGRADGTSPSATPGAGASARPGARPSSGASAPKPRSSTAPAARPAPSVATAPAPKPPQPPVVLPTTLPPLPVTPPTTLPTTLPVQPPVAVGDTVKVISGALLGITGKVTAVDTTARTATIAWTVLGITKTATLPWTSIAKV
jgi:membrane-bound lytic murein transglycosylase B